jgi:hypothetical protein
MSKKQEDQAPTANLPVNIEDAIRKQLEAQKGQLGALPANKISLKNKEFALPDGQKGPTIEVVILDFVWFMVNYPGVYNSNDPKKPNCFAVGRDNPEPKHGEVGLKPHPSSADPQGTDCATCPKNEWGSAGTGRGKACKNQRRLVVLAPDADAGSEPMSVYVSPGGLKYFDAYVARLQNEHGLLPVQVITKISFDPNQTYPLLNFALVGKHDNMNLFWAKREQAQELLFRETETEKK